MAIRKSLLIRRLRETPSEHLARLWKRDAEHPVRLPLSLLVVIILALFALLVVVGIFGGLVAQDVMRAHVRQLGEWLAGG